MDEPSAAGSGAINVRSAAYFIASTEGGCTQCGETTRLLALALPGGHEVLDPDAAPEAADAWQPAPLPAVLFDVHCLAEPVRRELQHRSAAYRLSEDAAGGGARWSNHCEHCGAVQDEQALHGEPDVAFMPMSPEAAAAIRLDAIPEPLCAGASGYSADPAFFDCMTGP
jgi:hypothetical protein